MYFTLILFENDTTCKYLEEKVLWDRVVYMYTYVLQNYL